MIKIILIFLIFLSFNLKADQNSPKLDLYFEELLEVENVYIAAQTLQNMLLDKELNKKHHDAHLTIIRNSRKLAYILIMEQAGYTILGKHILSAKITLISPIL